MTAVLTPPYLVAAGLLALGGAEKAWRPDSAGEALVAAGLPGQREAIRVAGAVETVLALAAAAFGGAVPAALVALAYLSFAAFVALAVARRRPLRSCGCFGKEDTPPTAGHLLVDLAAAGVAAAVAAGSAPGRKAPLADLLSAPPLHGVAVVGLTLVSGYLAYTVLTSSARLAGVRRSLRRPRP
jgi:methylamine utilization protein MauE